MYAIIDIGSNTIRLAIYKLENEKFTLLFNKKNTAGLASYIKDGAMTPEGIDKACDVLQEFQRLLAHFQIDNIFAFATAALRNASNSQRAVQEIVDRTGLEITVIDGNEEATLDFVGATSVMEMDEGLLVDIGGASTELVIYKERKILHTVSLPFGSLNTYNQFVGHLIPCRRERKEIKQAILAELEKHEAFCGGQYAQVCGVGGSARAAGKLNNFLFGLPDGNTQIAVPNVKKIIKRLENDGEENLISIDTLDILLKVVPDRVRTVLPGLMILNTIIRYYGAETIQISAAGVREGYLYNRVAAASRPSKPRRKQEAAKHEQTEKI